MYLLLSTEAFKVIGIPNIPIIEKSGDILPVRICRTHLHDANLLKKPKPCKEEWTLTGMNRELSVDDVYQ